VQGVSPTLEIVYRTQSKRSAAVPETSRQTRLNDDFGYVADREARDFALAIEASLRESKDDPELQRALAESLRDVVPKKDSEAEVTDSKNPADKPHTPWYSQSVATESTQSENVERDQQMGDWSKAELGTRSGKRKSKESQPGVIGRKIFDFDEAVLHAYVQDVLQWWRGERPPRGVDLEHTRRCS
jgi:exonuclease V